jgi:L-histidine N-alpha-methyltransferase
VTVGLFAGSAIGNMEPTGAVHVLGQKIYFEAGETIHTENSYKHLPEGFASLATKAGWRHYAMWTDPDQLFSLHLLKAEGH